MGLFEGMPGVGVPGDSSEASHLGLLSWAVTACLGLLILLQVGLGPKVEGGPSRRPEGDNQVTCWLPGPATGPWRSRTLRSGAWVGAGLCRSQETWGHCSGQESGSDSQASRLFF